VGRAPGAIRPRGPAAPGERACPRRGAGVAVGGSKRGARAGGSPGARTSPCDPRAPLGPSCAAENRARSRARPPAPSGGAGQNAACRPRAGGAAQGPTGIPEDAIGNWVSSPTGTSPSAAPCPGSRRRSATPRQGRRGACRRRDAPVSTATRGELRAAGRRSEDVTLPARNRHEGPGGPSSRAAAGAKRSRSGHDVVTNPRRPGQGVACGRSLLTGPGLVSGSAEAAVGPPRRAARRFLCQSSEAAPANWQIIPPRP